jgi:colicin import membrane protein
VRGSLFSSVVLHAAILGWACLAIQSQPALPTPELVAPADLVTEDEFTRLRQGQRTAKAPAAEAKETPKPEPARTEAQKPAPQAAAPPAPSPPAPEKQEPEKQEPDKQEPDKQEPDKAAALPPPAPVPPPPGPAPEEQQRLEALVKEQERQAEEQRKEQERQAEEQERKRLEEEQKQAELKKKLEEEKKRKEAELKKKREEEKKRKEAEAKKRFDAERIAALLNRVPDKGAPPLPQVPSEPTRNKGPVLGAPEGRDKQLTASELAVLGQIIKSCVQAKWNLSGGGQDAMSLVIKLRLQFRPDGTLLVPPQVTNPQNTPYFLAASEGAIRAAQACEPYSLPTEKYEFWKDVIMTFDPREMYR